MIFNKKLIKVVGFSFFLFLISLLKISFVFGSKAFFFSIFLLLAPLTGAFFGVGGTGAIFMLTKLLRYSFLGTFACTTTGIPTLFAAWCWRADRSVTDSSGPDLSVNKFSRFFLNLLIPIICFVLFFLHPSVGYGFLYGLYWMIPVSIYLLESFGILRINFFSTAFRSTFIAHAIGSVIWCYFVPMTPALWISLIPIVALERFVFAIGAALVYKLVRSENKIFYRVGRKVCNM